MRQEIGALITLWIDELVYDTTTKANPKAVESIKKQERNWVPAMVVQTGAEEYKVIGNDAIVAAAVEAGVDKIWCIIVDESPESEEAVKAQTEENHEEPKKEASTNEVQQKRDFIRSKIGGLNTQPAKPTTKKTTKPQPQLTYRQLQAKLKEARANGLTTIKLNLPKNKLQAEWERVSTKS